MHIWRHTALFQEGRWSGCSSSSPNFLSHAQFSFKGESCWLPVTSSSQHQFFYRRPNAVHSAGLWELAGHQQRPRQKVSMDRWLLAEPPACQWLATPLISVVFQGERAEHCQLLHLVLLVATCQGQHMVHTTYRESWRGDGCRSPTVIQGMPDSASWYQPKCHTSKVSRSNPERTPHSQPENW